MFQKFTDDKVINVFMNLLTTIFTGTCIDNFSDIVQVFEVQERIFDDGKSRTILVSFLNIDKEIQLGVFRLDRNEKKEWKKGNSMVFAVDTASTMFEMAKTPQVLFASNKPE